MRKTKTCMRRLHRDRDVQRCILRDEDWKDQPAVFLMSNMRFYSYVIPILGLPGLGSADSLVCCRIIKCLVAHDYKRGEFCKILPVVNLAAKVAKYPSVMLPSGKNNITNFSRIQYASLVSSFSEAHRTGYFAYSYITIVQSSTC